MIGKKTITVDAKDFVAGMSSSDEISDGGFSADTDQINIKAEVGVLHAPAAPVDNSDNLTGYFISACPDPNYLGDEKKFLDNEAAFYELDGSTITKQVTASSATFSEGTSSLTPFWGNWYMSTQNNGGDDVVKWNGNATLDEDWWSTLSGATSSLQPAAQRPLLVYEDRLWIADKEKLHNFDGTDPTVGKLVFDTFASITAMGIDPGSGYMLIATHSTGGSNASATKNGLAKIYIYDGFSDKPLRAIIVDGMVTAFYTLGGQTYVFYGNKMGYWNGSGITFLRQLDVNWSSSTLVFPAHITNIDNTLYFVDGLRVIAYGEILPGRKIFYPAFKQLTSAHTIRCITAISKDELGISYSDGGSSGKFVEFSVDSVATSGNLAFKTNRYSFDRPVFIRSVYIETATAVANNDSVCLVYLNDETDTDTQSNVLQNLTGGNIYHIETDSFDKKVRSVQFKFVGQGAGIGFRRFIISYDVAE